MKKRVVDGKVRAWHQTIFTVQAGPGSEREIVVHFGHRVKYHVVKLKTSDLPRADSRHRRITWWNNFAILHQSGKESVKKVRYTVFVPKPDKKQVLVYYADGQLHEAGTPKRSGRRYPRAHMVQIELGVGDPGIGCRAADPKPVQ